MNPISNKYFTTEVFSRNINFVNKNELISSVFNRTKECFLNLFEQLLSESTHLGLKKNIVFNIFIFFLNQIGRYIGKDLYCKSVNIKNQYNSFLEIDQNSEEFKSKKEQIQKNLNKWSEFLYSETYRSVNKLIFTSYKIEFIFFEKLKINILQKTLSVLSLSLFYFGFFDQTPDFFFHFLFNFDLILEAIFLHSMVKKAVSYGLLWTKVPIVLTIINAFIICNTSLLIIKKINHLAYYGFFDLSIPRRSENGELKLEKWKFSKLVLEIKSTPQNAIKKCKEKVVSAKEFYNHKLPQIKKELSYLMNICAKRCKINFK